MISIGSVFGMGKNHLKLLTFNTVYLFINVVFTAVGIASEEISSSTDFGMIAGLITYGRHFQRVMHHQCAEICVIKKFIYLICI